MRAQRKHVLAATVAVAASAALAVGTGLGFAETAPTAGSVCAGSVTFSAEGGAPAATSDRFPAGTRLRVTNLDNGRAATVTVTGPSGSCVLLNATAMDLVREPGKNVIRNNRVELVAEGDVPVGENRPGSARPAMTPPGGATGAAPARSVCSGAITFFAENAPPAATSDRFPVGTRLRVTNLDNGRAATVTVTGPSGSCVLLNAAAMDLIREPGKNLVRRNVVERVG
ncbi:septal ring lytic transglycosylase RlpA family protein [Micromonospora sp. PLK6-60]|uniref:septal ring lytic transglycosylase RlpA family protein n=1 Tax=Micromonospora sp. PLK6-60 TaxID=2873383 RepID=UPI001CA756F6|nr:septal ring lytic transglycosylase RlpA family protein [Micromonospora sp. PLK6-60]MBY8872191.1 septal ring lytic transglycosylase RlpA family protein [Micromonospora sp. PLK6-60]